MTETFSRALHLRFGLGWNLLPLKNKRPVVKWKRLQTEFATCDELQDWFEEDNFDIGIVTGRLSRLVAVDCDSPEAVSLWETLTRKDRGFCFQQQTSRGRHFIYKHPGGDIRNRIKANGFEMDLRGDGGYIAAKPNLFDWMGKARLWQSKPSYFSGAKSNWFAG